MALCNPLLSVKRLPGLFQRAPTDEHVHIVIQYTPNGVFRHLPYRVLGILRAIYSRATPATTAYHAELLGIRGRSGSRVSC